MWERDGKEGKVLGGTVGCKLVQGAPSKTDWVMGERQIKKI